jgi:hypothetical protein
MAKKARKITEKSGVHKDWYKVAKTQTVTTLPDFIKHLTEDYEHDYGTICHAITAAAIGAAQAVENSPQGGITGFQASAIMWEFIQHWMQFGDEPMRLVHYEEMLYPQYLHTFTSISKSTWKWMQAKAKEKLQEKGDDGNANVRLAPEVEAHLKMIVSGIVPFGYSVEGT